MSANLALQLSGLLGDLMFVACGAGALLYGLWLVVQNKSLVNLGRLSLVLAFGAALFQLVLGQGYLQGLSFPVFFIFLLMAIFLTLEFLFQMSVLGLLVSVVGALITSMRYWQLPPLTAIAPPNAQVAYWWVLRDMAFTVGAAVVVLTAGAVVLLAVFKDHRPGGPVHPNDLRDVSSLLARSAVPCFFFSLFAALVAAVHMPALLWADVWGLGWLVLLLILAVALMLTAGDRRARTPRVVGLVTVLVAGLLAFSVGPLALSGLTSRVMGP